MEPRMLDKINDLIALRAENERAANKITQLTNEVMAEIECIMVKADLPGRMLINLGNKLRR